MDLTLQQLAVPVSLVLLGFAVGIFLERVVLSQLRRLANVTRWPADNIIFAAFKGIPIFWGTTLGIYLATVFADADAEVVDLFQDLLVIAIVWSGTIVIARIGAGFVTMYASRERSILPPTSIIPNLVRAILYTIGFLIVLHQLTIDITPVLTAIGVGGLAVALALQETLGNVFAGLYILAARQLGAGDYIRIDTGDEGYITDINWRSTTVRTIYNNLVIVPNSKLASAVVTNYHKPQKEMLLRIPLGVAYDSDLDHVEKVTVEVGRSVLSAAEVAVRDEDVWIHFFGFGEFSLNFITFMRIPEYFDQYAIRHRFLKQLLKRFSEEGIEIPFPIKEFQMQLSPFDASETNPAQVERPDYLENPGESDIPSASTS